MRVDAYRAFVMMFYALDATYDGGSPDGLRNYLSDANPFLFKDEGSADASVFESFKSGFPDDADEIGAFRYVRDYLSRLDEVLLKSFDSVVDAEAWKRALG